MSEVRLGPQVLAYEAEREARGLLKRASARGDDALTAQAGYAQLWEIIGPHCGGEYEAEIRVALGALVVGPHPIAIAALTGVPRHRVMKYGRRLLDNGIWTIDGKVSVSFTDEEPSDMMWIMGSGSL